VSRTDNTRSVEIQIADEATLLVGGRNTVPVIGGIKSAGKPSKPVRRHSTRQRRQHNRRVEREALAIMNKDEFDPEPCPSEFRSIARQRTRRIESALEKVRAATTDSAELMMQPA